jgi:polysaccharide pyruvyl transferase WcaK-like protein/tetratricopeptide (TPR) repeat protein
MPTEHARRLAIFGTFDVENYGDLLFPLIAGQRLGHLGVEVVAVSPTARATRYRDAVLPLSYPEFVRDIDSFDGVLIGGGNIVHTKDFGLPDYAATAYAELWIGATAQAVRQGLPVLWNAPGVLQQGAGRQAPEWLQRTVEAADHFVVRDSDSAERLESWSGLRPGVVPDTALDLARLWPPAVMKDRFSDIRASLGIADGVRVVALHVKARSLQGVDIPTYAKSLANVLRRAGAVAVLVALGRCHGDHALAEEIQRLVPDCTYSIADTDHLRDMAATIAGSDAYIGSSLHGHITAAAYGVAARLVAVPMLHKFMGQARQMNRAQDVVENWAAALDALPDLLALAPQSLPANIAAQLDDHWQEVAKHLASGRKHPRCRDVFSGNDLDAALDGAIREAERPAPGRVLKSDPAAPAQAQKGNFMTETSQTEWDSAAVNQMISGGDLDAAALRIRAALDQKADFLPARLAEVRHALAMGDATRAVELASVLSNARPGNPWVLMAHLQSLCGAAEQDAARALFLTRLAEVEIDEPMMTTALNTLLAALPQKQQVAFLKSVHEAKPESVVVQLRLAMRAHVSGDRQLTIDMLERAERAGPLPPYAARVRSQVSPFTGTMDAATDRLLAEWDAGAEDVETLCRLCRFAAAAGRFDLSLRALQRALELHPLEWRTLYRLNRVFLGSAEERKIHETLAQIDATAQPGANWRLQFALFSLRTGQDAQGRAVLASLTEHPATGPTARSLLDALTALGSAAPRAEVIRDEDVRVVKQAGARGTILVFGGFLGGLSHLSDRYLDLLLSELPANVVYLRDPYGRVYMNGLPAFGPTEELMHAGLSRIVTELGGGTVLTMGGSAAGYSALRAGLAIRADKVISLAGFMTPGPVDHGDPAHIQQGFAEFFSGDLQSYDLRDALKAQPETRLVQVIGGDYAPDVSRARALDGVENARVEIIPGFAMHHVALPAITDGTLKRLLQDAFA